MIYLLMQLHLLYSIIIWHLTTRICLNREMK
nr:MAG TPA: hypothetical protein [Caudoviricetes sp.]